MKKNIMMLFLVSLLGVSQIFGQREKLLSADGDQFISSAIGVTIGGSFIVTGTFQASPTERLDNLITRVYNSAKLPYLSQVRDMDSFQRINEEVENYALRDIKLKRFSGEVLTIDLLKFRMTGDFKHNPYLENDDVIIFPAYDEETNFVEISGAINVESPYTFQFVEGDKLSDAILFAQGINTAYERVDSAEISRLSYDGKTEEKILVKISDDYDLEAGDRIRILAKTTDKKAYSIEVRGEVNKEGIIYITKDNTTVAEVIEKVGGFKPTADLNRAELIRSITFLNSPNSNRETEMMLMQRMANIDIEDSLTFLTDNRLRLSRGSSVVDFTKIDDPNSPDANFIVKDGDVIYVPEQQKLVYVFGQVLTPGYIEFKEGEGYQYYINQAGGISKFARGEIYLIKGKTRSWIELEEDTKEVLEEGDFIWVPKEPYRDFDYYLTRIGSFAQIIGSIATVIVLIVQLGK